MKIGSILSKGTVLWISTSYKTNHQGNDFAKLTIMEKTAMFACDSGIVSTFSITWNGRKFVTGFYIIGDNKAIYLYNHCMLTVPAGSRVERGHAIGYVDTMEHQLAMHANTQAPHCHFEVHPTGDWNYRDQPLSYFDRNEVKYNKQPACTSTSLNYVGIPDKQLPDPIPTIKWSLEERVENGVDNLYMTKINVAYRGYCFITRSGATFKQYIDTISNGKHDRKLIGDMNSKTTYTVDWAFQKTNFVNNN